MAAQAEYQVYKIARSDGVDTGPGYWPGPAEAAAAKAKKGTKDATEKPTRTKAPMIRLPEYGDKFIEWRVKLGILLKQELSPAPNEGLPWYVEFPRGYWLYEKSNRTYVVSGYPNRKLFKSPQEFGVHLLWLLGNSENYADCCCVHCNIPVPGPARPSAQVEEEPEKANPTKHAQAQVDSSGIGTSIPPTTVTPTAASVGGGAVQKKAQTSIQPGAASSAGTKGIAPALAPAPSPTPAQQAAMTTASPVPTGMPRGPPASLLFRVGELVWFQNGASWKIGLILQSTPFVPSVPTTHQVLPIGLGMVQQPIARKDDKDLRPFQAFSVPAVQRNELKNRSFDNINWDNVMGRLHQAAQTNASPTAQSDFDTALLDSSKLAAIKIHHSTSLFTKLSLVKDGATFYYGCFLGAERVEASDILRVKPPPQFENLNNVFFFLKVIRIMDTHPATPIFQGMLCHLVEGPDPSNREAVSPATIPWGLRDELAWRQSIDPATPRKLVPLQNYSCREADVKGRFYPSSRLGPILAPDKMEKAKENKNPSMVSLPLNDRLSAGSVSPTASPYLGLRKNRLDMAGISVPHSTQFAFEASVSEE